MQFLLNEIHEIDCCHFSLLSYLPRKITVECWYVTIPKTVTVMLTASCDEYSKERVELQF